MNKKLKEKVKESLTSVIPITLIVFVLSISITPMDPGTIVLFFMGAILLIFGMGLFSIGAEMSMTPIGEGIGVQITKTKKLWFIAFICFIMGVIITIAEPDLQVLAEQVQAFPNQVLILTVAVGVGIFLVLAVFRVLFKLSLSKMLIALYSIVFVVSIFVPNDFIAVAFDSGGVTTGPITVPFIMALGVGLSSVRSDKNSRDDSFGFVALGSIGPILSVLILGILYNPQDVNYVAESTPQLATMQDAVFLFAKELPHTISEVLMAILPLVAFLFVFQLFSRRYTKRQIIKILVGFIYTWLGVALFLTGVNVGFAPVGTLVGEAIGGSTYKWLLVPIAMLIGYFIVAAEPAVHVLNKQVEEVTDGTITSSMMNTCLSIGVAVSLGLSMIRILTGISIYWIIIPGYAIALILSFFVPKIFTGIAFDSGGVATGPMATTFIIPFAIGACTASGGNIMTDAFGTVAMIAMTPLITIQILGLIYRFKTKSNTAVVEVDSTDLPQELPDVYDDDIIDYEDKEELEENISENKADIIL